jgi:two-component system chemotaxis response regulator CheY
VSSAKRILVVDDDDTIRELVAMALSDDGYEVDSAAHGLQAIELVEERPPDLILLDMRMPIMDGWEFVEAYRAMRGRHAPVIVLTAGRDAAAIAADVHADGFLPKPFDLDHLLSLVACATARKPDGHGG